MNTTRRLGLSLALTNLVFYMVSVIMWLAQDLMTRGLFILESMLAYNILLQLSMTFTGPGLKIRLAMLRVQMGSIDHGHGSALHWTVALVGGFVLSAIIGQTFTGALPWNLNNWVNPANFGLYAVTMIFGTLIVYYVLREY